MVLRSVILSVLNKIESVVNTRKGAYQAPFFCLQKKYHGDSKSNTTPSTRITMPTNSIRLGFSLK